MSDKITLKHATTGESREFSARDARDLMTTGLWILEPGVEVPPIPQPQPLGGPEPGYAFPLVTGPVDGKRGRKGRE